MIKKYLLTTISVCMMTAMLLCGCGSKEEEPVEEEKEEVVLVIEEEEKPENTALSGISERPFCKGRAYDPNRYSKNSTEE